MYSHQSFPTLDGPQKDAPSYPGFLPNDLSYSTKDEDSTRVEQTLPPVDTKDRRMYLLIGSKVVCTDSEVVRNSDPGER